MTLRLIFLAFFFLVLSGERGYSQSCSVTSASGNYGSVDVLAGAAVDTTSTFTVTCGGCAAGCTFNICVQFDQGSPNPSSSVRTMGSGANTAQHELYSDAARTQVWGSWGYGTTSYGTGGISQNLTSPILFGNTSTSFTVYGRFKGSQQTTIPGTYTWSTNSAIVAWASYIVFSPNCTSNPGNTATAGSSPWVATVAAGCNVSTTGLDFGSASLLTSAINATATLSVRCTNTTAYSLGLDNGTQASGSQRRMRLGATSNFINYNLYTNSGLSNAWTTTTSPTSCTSGAGTCSLGTGTGSSQNVTVYGQVPAQASPPSGIYTDTVVVTVTF